ncbi:unnamed protein product [Blepharisma stoltei]|uniref:Uncharacterized protein n=1 Tax=Blepharisma stoltei TaxID=1481888 RepID=A0AAU9IR46_9CILI|nr:unnamed protein product [Blepharisma stoltei]
MDFKSKLKLTGTARMGLCERFASLISEIPDELFNELVDAGKLDDLFDDFSECDDEDSMNGDYGDSDLSFSGEEIGKEDDMKKSDNY